MFHLIMYTLDTWKFVCNLCRWQDGSLLVCRSCVAKSGWEMWVGKVWFYFLFLFLFIFSYLQSLHSVMQASTGHMGAFNETVKSTVMVISTIRSPLLQSNCVQTGPLMWVIEFVIETQPGSDLFAVLNILGTGHCCLIH